MGNHYKDSLFRSLFDNKTSLLELYNSIKGTSYGASTDLSINTLSETLFSHLKNDVSFILEGKLIILVEHQSTINENMPFRFLLYIVRLLENYITTKKVIYGRKLVMLPCPEFIIIYNGTANFPAKKTLRLSDAFKKAAGVETNMELVVTVYNIKKSENKDIIGNSRLLEGYISYVDKVQEEKGIIQAAEPGMPPAEMQRTAVAKAIEYCKRNGILTEFWQSLTQEEMNMLVSEWNMEDALEVAREEGMEDCIEKGIEKDRKEVAEKALRKGLSVDLIQDLTGLSLERIQELRSATTTSTSGR